METSRVLMVVTSSDHVGSAPDPTGLWLDEFAAPYYVFTDARCDITVASPKGGPAPIDPRSHEASAQTAATRRYAADDAAQAALRSTLPLRDAVLSGYDAVFFAGGHGTMEDFPTDDHVKATVEHFHHYGKPIAALCHGPAALVRAVRMNGEPVVKGRQFTCFSDAEETAIGLQDHVPFLLESTLESLGGRSVTEAAFTAHTIVDGPLITGQNPASSIGTAEAVIHRLRMRAAA